ncbi:MAG: molybdopterin-dependent oxidoreductase [Desulfobacterales bacterium]|nr:molybdopterin-dependent oxidoreductase [Desulfobacterales bacterium]
MIKWQKTSCVLCSQNCGLEVQVEDNQIIKVRPDKDNPRSIGYACRKGMNISHHQHHDDRLTHPLKRTPNGFVKISWEEATAEIAEKLLSIVNKYGPKSFAYVGGGGQGCHFEAAFGTTLMKALGSRYHYNALAQELTGYFWGCGRMFGRQNRFLIADEHHSDMILGIGWNGMVSHQMPRAPIILKEFAKNPEKVLAIIDPRKSETAKIANIHIPLKPGTDALLARAMIAIIIQEGWEAKSYINSYASGFEKILPWFEKFDVKTALEVCEVEYDAVYALCKELSKRKWCMHFDLGVYMNRHSSLTTYLYMLLLVICGRALIQGGNVIPGIIMPLGSNNDERNPKTWRTVSTNIPAIMGYFPPNVLPEEILSDHPERIRSVICSSSNPLRSYADTTAYEAAFKKLDLLVTIELSMTETAELSHYVLPSRSAYESYDSAFFSWNFPEVYFQLRQPVVKPSDEKQEAGEILTRIADAAGIIPKIPDYLYKAAKKDRLEYTAALFSFAILRPKVFKILPFILAKTLGKEMGSANLSVFWGLLVSAPPRVRKMMSKAGFITPSIKETILSVKNIIKTLTNIIRYKNIAPIALLIPQINYAESLFETILEHPEGLWLGKADAQNNFKEIKTKDGKINLYIPEMEEWIKEITSEDEKKALVPNPEFPMLLNAGRHKPENANTLMRNPEWNKGRRSCTLAMHPDDAGSLGVEDGEIVRIITEAATEEIELEISKEVRQGQVLIPHGFGLKYKGEPYGVNVNRLTKNTHRDKLAGTPLHRYVPCRVEKIHKAS